MLKYLADKLLKRQRINGDTGIYKFAQGWKRVSRIVLVNHLIKIHSYKSYLEIGIRKKARMNDLIETKRISSVDPDPMANAEYCMTSDDYFSNHDEKFDIIFIDGLHEGQQVKRDIENSLNVLNKNGHILLHDINPPTAFHARENYEVNGKYPSWNGTSWEGYAWHRKNSPNLSMCVVDTDWGVGIIKAGKQKIWLGDVSGYATLETNREELLNLISVQQFLKEYPA